MMRFDRFTERAQEAAQRAAEIIQRYGHTQIDTEHPVWLRAQLGLIEAGIHTRPRSVVAEFFAAARSSKRVRAKHCRDLASQMIHAGRTLQAREMCAAGEEQFPEADGFGVVYQELREAAEAAPPFYPCTF